MVYLIRLLRICIIILGSLGTGFYIAKFDYAYPSSYELARNEGLERYQTQLESLLATNQGHYQSLPASDPFYNILQRLPFPGHRDQAIKQLRQMVLQSDPRAMYWGAQLIQQGFSSRVTAREPTLFDFNHLTLLQMAAANKHPYAASELAQAYKCKGDGNCQNPWLDYAKGLLTKSAEEGDYHAKYELSLLNTINVKRDAAQLDEEMSFAIEAAKHQYYYPLANLLDSYQHGYYLPAWVDTSYGRHHRYIAYLNATDRRLITQLTQWLTDRQYSVEKGFLKIAQQKLDQDAYHRLFLQHTLLGAPHGNRDLYIGEYYSNLIFRADTKKAKQRWAIEAVALLNAITPYPYKEGALSDEAQYFYDNELEHDITYGDIRFGQSGFEEVTKLTKKFRQKLSHNLYLTPYNYYYIPNL